MISISILNFIVVHNLKVILRTYSGHKVTTELRKKISSLKPNQFLYLPPNDN